VDVSLLSPLDCLHLSGVTTVRQGAPNTHWLCAGVDFSISLYNVWRKQGILTFVSSHIFPCLLPLLCHPRHVPWAVWWSNITLFVHRNQIKTLSIFSNVTHIISKFLGRMKCKKMVKCTLVQALRLCTGRTAHRGSRGTALLLHDHGTSRGWGVSVTPRPLFTPGKDPVPIVQEAGCAPGPVWTGVENLASTGIWCPDRPARSQSLHRVRYPAYRMKYKHD
jgi:hypothetical protein